MIFYLKHHRAQQPIEIIRCHDLQRARRMCVDLEEVGESAWIENEGGRKIQLWEFWNPRP